MSTKFICLKNVMAILLSINILSCSSSNSSIEELPYLTVKSVSPQNLAAAGGEITIRVSSYPIATAQSDAGWITLKSNTSSDSLTSFTFTAKASAANCMTLRKFFIFIPILSDQSRNARIISLDRAT